VNKFIPILFLIFVVSCCTMVPPPITSSGPSFDNGERNSGLICWVTNNSVPYGLITTNARNRYNYLIENYGKRLSPPITKDFGIINVQTNYLITLQGLSYFGTMNNWRKNESPK